MTANAAKPDFCEFALFVLSIWFQALVGPIVTGSKLHACFKSTGGSNLGSARNVVDLKVKHSRLIFHKKRVPSRPMDQWCLESSSTPEIAVRFETWLRLFVTPEYILVDIRRCYSCERARRKKNSSVG